MISIWVGVWDLKFGFGVGRPTIGTHIAKQSPTKEGK